MPVSIKLLYLTWHSNTIAVSGKEVGLLCRSGVDHPKWRLAVSIRFLVEGIVVLRCFGS